MRRHQAIGYCGHRAIGKFRDFCLAAEVNIDESQSRASSWRSAFFCQLPGYGSHNRYDHELVINSDVASGTITAYACAPVPAPGGLDSNYLIKRAFAEGRRSRRS